MTSGGFEPDIERDLLNDRSKLPGAVAYWRGLSARRRRRWLRRFAQAERHRFKVEARLLSEGLMDEWSKFPPTEQREILAGIDYLRLLPLGKRDWQHVLRAVERGSDYRRAAGEG